MSPRLRVAVRESWRFPRVSGDEPLKRTDASGSTAFSPRERGWPVRELGKTMRREFSPRERG